MTQGLLGRVSTAVLWAVVLALCLAGAVLIRPEGVPEPARSAPEPSPRFFQRLRGKIDDIKQETVDRFAGFTGQETSTEKEKRLHADQIACRAEEAARRAKVAADVRSSKAASAKEETIFVACTVGVACIANAGLHSNAALFHILTTMLSCSLAILFARDCWFNPDDSFFSSQLVAFIATAVLLLHDVFALRKVFTEVYVLDDKHPTVETGGQLLPEHRSIAASSIAVIAAQEEEALAGAMPPCARAEDASAALLEHDSAAMPEAAAMEDAPAAAATRAVNSQPPLAAPAPPSPPAVAETEHLACFVDAWASECLGDFVWNPQTVTYDWKPAAEAAASPVNSRIPNPIPLPRIYQP
jgi:hypothetical protein